MSNRMSMNNIAVISGQITPGFRPCPGKNRQNFYIADIAVKRLSGYIDYIPVTISKKLAPAIQNNTGHDIWISGRFISCNYHDLEGSHLSLSLFAETYAFLKSPKKNENIIFLDGYISRDPVFRITPHGHRITELMVAINYPYMESDYIPCICWNNNALMASLFPCGTHIQALGRIQSRVYLKKINESETYIRTAYEISIWKIVQPDNPFENSQII